MNPARRRFASAVLTLIGTIIGVGIFGIPYALSQAGFILAVTYFTVLGGVQVLQHLFFAEAAIACPDKLRLVGLTERYLGRAPKQLTAVALTCSNWGAMLAYMLVGGTFLHVLLSPFIGGPVLAYQIGWSVVAATMIYFGLDFITRIGDIATVGLLVVMLFLLAMGLPHVHPLNFVPWTGHDLLLPYGIVLFSLSGLPAILEMEDILKTDHVRYRRAVVRGTLTAIILTAVFSFTVWGVTGAGTTQDAIVGLSGVLGSGVGVVGATFGFLAVATSFFPTAVNLQSTFRYDYKRSRNASWLLTVVPPFVALLAGTKNFVEVVSFTGAVFGGITAIMVSALYIAVTRRHAVAGRKALGVPVAAAYGTIVLLVVGAVLTSLEALQSLFV